ncbi:hypothetical protein [Mechercharimyces sp. CAU 1602]|uniref:lysine 5,6-aminomutase reactivase subunit KamB n=1 Tax=Mechercharimyces sp. CAU 1602 TaxID=2973933 RepID=UPI0021618AA0|nr:hypothetical protein [Mechercharimyces sp. CAU 1602]MCS1352635.1 hypothetical protein [Mechercharimyces sp. CAU 1602]
MLRSLLAEEIPTSVAVIGLAKNVGKTTVVNALVEVAKQSSIPLGVMSIGVDGEERDVWSGKEKPAIRVPVGTLVATASPYLERERGNWEVVASLPLISSVGQIIIARANHPIKRVTLAGLSNSKSVQMVKERFIKAGVKLTLIDGAYDRKASASPFLTDQAVLVVGASMGRSLAAVVRQTREALALFSLPTITEGSWQKAGELAVECGKVVLVRKGKVEVTPYSSLLTQTEELFIDMVQKQDIEGLALPGVLTERMLVRMMQVKRSLTILVCDPTRCFLSHVLVRQFFRAGHRLGYLRSLPLRAVAINPYAPQGYRFDPVQLKSEMVAACPGIPVIDVQQDAWYEDDEGGDGDVYY